MKVLCMADLHLSETRPVCRTDEDWIEKQEMYLSKVVEIATEEKVDAVVIAGDLFDKSTVSSAVVNMMFRFIITCRNNGIVVDFNAGTTIYCTIQ